MPNRELQKQASLYANDEYTHLNNIFFEYQNKKYNVAYFVPWSKFYKSSSKLLLLPFIFLLPYFGEKIRKRSMKHKQVDYSTGFIVFDDKQKIITDKNLALNLIRNYYVWEYVYLDPYFSKNNTIMFKQNTEFRKKIIEKIKNITYPKANSEFEQNFFSALKELDKDVIESEEIYERATIQILNIFDLFVRISDNPSDKYLNQLKEKSNQILQTFTELEKYTEKRIENWQNMIKEKQKLDFFKETTQTPLNKIESAFIEDLLGYALQNIPMFNTIKTSTKELGKFLLDKYGGYKALMTTRQDYFNKKIEIEKFLKLFERDISLDRIRIK
ncbi:Uncharacterised protein [uncultured archaeon]|nr:Uncharacterised protein [uncultured archaeon]